jgi:hypothetical protein
MKTLAPTPPGRRSESGRLRSLLRTYFMRPADLVWLEHAAALARRPITARTEAGAISCADSQLGSRPSIPAPNRFLLHTTAPVPDPAGLGGASAARSESVCQPIIQIAGVVLRVQVAFEFCTSSAKTGERPRRSWRKS